MYKKLTLVLIFLLSLAACSKGDSSLRGLEGDLEKPSEILEIASTDDFQFRSNNLNVGIFNFDHTGLEALALFQADFSNIYYNGFTNDLCFTVTVNDEDYMNSEYRYELHSVDLDYKRSSGTIYALSKTTVHSICIDSVNDGGLWEVIMYKTTDSTDEFVEKAHGFFFQIKEFDQRHQVSVLFEQNLDLPPQDASNSIEYHLRIDTEGTIDYVKIKVIDRSNNEEVMFSMTLAEAYLDEQDVFDMVSTVYLLQVESSYDFYVYVTGSDGVSNYKDMLIKHMVFHTE